MLLVVVLIVSMLSIAITPIIHSVFILSVAGKPTRLTVVMLNAVAPSCATTTDPEFIEWHTLKIETTYNKMSFLVQIKFITEDSKRLHYKY
jgi:hypothetical protein